MKRFVFDQLVDAENICNLKKEKQILLKHIHHNDKIIVYGPRNYGKTSLLKNVIIKNFQKRHKKSFIFFADLMEVKDINSLTNRLQNAFEHSFSNSFPAKSILENIKDLISTLRPEITIDPLTASSSISLKMDIANRNNSIDYIFNLINEIGRKIHCLIILDEFQDIINIPEAQALFRNAFQVISNLPVVLMGSKRHILADIFSKPQAPLSSWGQDMEFPPISYHEYHDYIMERFTQKKITINYNNCKYLQKLLLRIPEPINIICHQIFEHYKNCEITKEEIGMSLRTLLDKKESRYEAYIANFSKAEEKILIQLSKVDKTNHPQSKEFVSKTGVTSRTVGQVFTRFINKGIIEKIDDSYRISNPLLNYYLKYYR